MIPEHNPPATANTIATDPNAPQDAADAKKEIAPKRKTRELGYISTENIIEKDDLGIAGASIGRKDEAG